MDNQEFDDIIKGKLENYQDTGSFDEGALDNMLDNLPNAGNSGGGGAAGGLPTWMQSSWLPIGVAASVLFNIVVITMLWSQRQTVKDMQHELKQIKLKSSSRDTIFISKTDTIYISGTNTYAQNRGNSSTQPLYYNQAGIGFYYPYLGHSYTSNPLSDRLPGYNRPGNEYLYSNRGYNRTESSYIPGTYAPSGNNNLGQKYLRAGSNQLLNPSSNFRQKQTIINGSVNPNSLFDRPNTGHINTSNTPISLKNELNSYTKNAQPLLFKNTEDRLAAERSLIILAPDSVRLLSRLENPNSPNQRLINIEKVEEPTLKFKRKKARKSLWNNIGVQLGITSGLNIPLFDLGEVESGIPIGFKAEISLGERLRLHTGIDFYAIEQEITGLPTNLNTSERFPNLNTTEELKEIKTTANVLDVPIQLRYVFGERFTRIKPFIGAGILARKMSNLETSYTYDDDDANEFFMLKSSWQFTSYQAILGAEVFLMRNLNLQLNAYYNGSFQALGTTSSNFNNLGINAGLFFTIK